MEKVYWPVPGSTDESMVGRGTSAPPSVVGVTVAVGDAVGVTTGAIGVTVAVGDAVGVGGAVGVVALPAPTGVRWNVSVPRSNVGGAWICTVAPTRNSVMPAATPTPLTPFESFENRKPPLWSVTTACSLPSAVNVTVTPSRPGSDGPCKPSPSASTHTRSPISMTGSVATAPGTTAMRTMSPPSANCTRSPAAGPMAAATYPAGMPVASTRQGQPGRSLTTYVPSPASVATIGVDSPMATAGMRCHPAALTTNCDVLELGVPAGGPCWSASQRACCSACFDGGVSRRRSRSAASSAARATRASNCARVVSTATRSISPIWSPSSTTRAEATQVALIAAPSTPSPVRGFTSRTVIDECGSASSTAALSPYGGIIVAPMPTSASRPSNRTPVSRCGSTGPATSSAASCCSAGPSNTRPSGCTTEQNANSASADTLSIAPNSTPHTRVGPRSVTSTRAERTVAMVATSALVPEPVGTRNCMVT